MAEEVIKTTSCCNDAMMGGLLGAMANRDNNLHHFACNRQQKRDESAAFDLHGKMGSSLPRADSTANGCNHRQCGQNAKG